MKLRRERRTGVAQGRALALGLALGLAGVACGGTGEAPTVTATDASGAPSAADAVAATAGEAGAPVSPAPAAVLARVEGTVITQADLERSLAQNLGRGAHRLLDETAQHKVLESLVLNRAMALQVEEELSPERRNEIESYVQAYRETLLAREFVAQETQDVELTEAMIEQYYREHPAEFGARSVRRYELLKGQGKVGEEGREALVALLGEAGRPEALGESWLGFAGEQRVRAAGITLFRGELEPGLFEPRVERLLQDLSQGQVSEVVFVGGVPYRARVTALEQTEPKPYVEVRDQAFQRVKARKLKEALAEIKDEVLGRVAVEYVAVVRSETSPVGTGAEAEAR